MPPSTLIFEYEPATRRIIMDGEYKFSSIYVKPSPFTAWTIAVRDPDVDLAGVTGITMELVCAVSVQY